MAKPLSPVLAHGTRIFVLLLTIASNCVCQTADTATPLAGLDPLNAYLSFSTNCPAIQSAVLEVRFNRFAPLKTYEFRYQPDALFGREFCTNSHEVGGICPRDKMAGRWHDQYWYYEPGDREPLLYTYNYLPSDTNSTCYGGYQYFNVFLGMFQSSGMSDQGVNTLKPTGTRFTFFDSRRRAINTVEFERSGGAPTWVSTERWMGSRRSANRSSLRYDTRIAPPGIPTEIAVDEGEFRMVLHALTLADTNRSPSKDDFFPAALFADTNIARVTFSNGTQYYTKGPLTLSMDSLPQPDLRTEKGRRFYFLGIFAICIAIVAIWIALRRGHGDKSQPTVKMTD